MGSAKMHADQVYTDAALVRRLLAEQFPQWAGLPIVPVSSYGTDHDIYRIGGHLAARMPRIGWATAQAELEARWLPRLAPHLPLAVPVQLARGRPALGYPFDWSVYEWLPGTNASPDDGTNKSANGATGADPDAGTSVGASADPEAAASASPDAATSADRDAATSAVPQATTSASDGRLDLDRAAVDLAAFIRALQSVDTTGAHPRPRGARGSPLAENDEGVRKAIHDLGDRIDGAAALRAWEESLDAPAYEGPGVWLHGDLLPGNLLVVDGQLSAVIDFGGLNVGDPAADLMPAWNVFTGRSRQRFREATGADDAQWLRGRGWALTQAVIALPYYWDTNPGMVRQAMLAVTEVMGTPAR
jgi:aminoglycoside phosphotransferase (APT) family kinase protein